MVLLLDILKGIVAVAVASVLFGSDFSVQATAGVASVAGHNFPVWLKFRGGRGLATAAGVMFVIAWPFVAMWGCLWVIAFALTKHVNVGNTAASAAMLIGVVTVPAAALGWLVDPAVTIEFRVFGIVLFILILVKHIGPVREYLARRAEVRQ
jgi:glycerol-3-phosphate acyltransferase PlsY